MAIRIGAATFFILSMSILLLLGVSGVAMGVKCTVQRSMFLSGGRAHAMSRRVTPTRDKTRLYGPGVIMLGASTIVAAVALPFVPLHRPRRHRFERPRLPVFWQVIGYCMLAGFCCVMIAVMFGVR